MVSVVCYRRRRLVFKREWRREKRQQDLDLDDEHSLSSVLKKFLDEKCEWCDRIAATPISTFKTAAAECCGMSSKKDRRAGDHCAVEKTKCCLADACGILMCFLPDWVDLLGEAVLGDCGLLDTGSSGRLCSC